MSDAPKLVSLVVWRQSNGVEFLIAGRDDGAIFRLLGIGSTYANELGDQVTITVPRWEPFTPVTGTDASAAYHEERAPKPTG